MDAGAIIVDLFEEASSTTSEDASLLERTLENEVAV